MTLLAATRLQYLEGFFVCVRVFFSFQRARVKHNRIYIEFIFLLLYSGLTSGVKNASDFPALVFMAPRMTLSTPPHVYSLYGLNSIFLISTYSGSLSSSRRNFIMLCGNKRKRKNRKNREKINNNDGSMSPGILCYYNIRFWAKRWIMYWYDFIYCVRVLQVLFRPGGGAPITGIGV